MAILLFVLLVVLFAINVPIAIVLGLVSTISMAAIGNTPLIVIPQKMFAALDSFPLMAAPFFILAGKLMEHGGISRRLVEFAESLVGQLKGGLGHVGIVACMFFAALSGSGSATTAAVGSILIPAMVRAGYDRSFATAIHAAAGTTGIIIPPSVPMVMYGVSAGVSVGSLFLAGVLPGILIGLSLMAVTYVISHRRGYGAASERTGFQKIWASFKRSALALFMPVIILGGIYGGFFTPTEASVVAVVYGFVIGTFVYKTITRSVLRDILISSVVTTSVILFIVATAALLGMLLTRERIPQSVAALLMDADLSPALIVVLVNLLLLVVGTFMEAIAAIIILTPILLPVVTGIGMDPVHFGIIMVVNLAIGLITPPVGVCLFVGAQVGQIRFEPLVRAVVPFLLMMVVDLFLLSYLPVLTVGPVRWLGVGN